MVAKESSEQTGFTGDPLRVLDGLQRIAGRWWGDDSFESIYRDAYEGSYDDWSWCWNHGYDVRRRIETVEIKRGDNRLVLLRHGSKEEIWATSDDFAVVVRLYAERLREIIEGVENGEDEY